MELLCIQPGSPGRTCASGLVVLVMLIAPGVRGAVHAHAPLSPSGQFVVLPETVSPDRRHAFAWGLPASFRVDWKKVEAGDDSAISAAIARGQTIENYLVDLRARRILSTVPGCHYWREVDDDRFRYLSATWSPTGRFAVATFHGRWETYAIVLIALDRDKVVDQADILSPARRAIRTWLAANRSSEYRRFRRHLTVTVPGPLAFGSPDGLSLPVSAGVPRKETLLDGMLTLRFGLDTRGRLSVEVDTVVPAVEPPAAR
ncbi:MAG: hypothetical protein HY815_10320 [Candidatus Riflebacteria bacterium]|nr:hypothetical protein [Candidatus Riflebacteria bacterium]